MRGQGWGPSHQTWRRSRSWRWWLGHTALAIVVLDWLGVLTGSAASTVLVVIVLVAVGVFVARHRRRWRRRPRRVINPAAEVARLGGGTYLGVGRDGGWRVARANQAVLVLGPPQSGKTSAVMIPAVLSHTGPVVSTSTKPDVLAATSAARSTSGPVWEFDPCGQTAGATGCQSLRWSPVPAARDWDGAIRVARAMVTGAGAGVGAGTTDATHWSKRATALLAAMLHAAAVAGRNVDAAVGWVLSHEFDEPGAILEAADARLACGLLRGLVNTEARERSSICSAAADALDAYSGQAAQAAASDPNFDPDAFVTEGGTMYVNAPAELQAVAAPLICGLLSEIRRATYHAARDGGQAGRVLFALDEAANIAPLAELPAIASEGGGQGLTLLAAFQDLSQARGRWGPAADGFLTLFGSKLILPGVADQRTLESLSVALAEYDRRMVAHSRHHGGPSTGVLGSLGRTVSTHRERVLSAGEIANIPIGHGLRLDGVGWELVALTPAHRSDPWRDMTTARPARPNASEAIR